MKKFLKTLLATMCVLSLAACGGKTAETSTGGGSTQTKTETSTQTKTEAPAEIKDVYLFTCTFMDVPNSETVKNMENKIM